ncbi:hypothetical protein BKA61DRAFT_291327 [Leptodontidium sp. MPI-SDFR-AT-0119]|nr:hypothetical protein BKA61DRAFT_291327 [Leptodontidium sp. MPI-SDFR-AT-0119]
MKRIGCQDLDFRREGWMDMTRWMTHGWMVILRLLSSSFPLSASCHYFLHFPAFRHVTPAFFCICIAFAFGRHLVVILRPVFSVFCAFLLAYMHQHSIP